MGRDTAGRLRFGVLGPLEAARADEQVRLGGERQRALLALLLVHANELVTVDQLADDAGRVGAAACAVAGRNFTRAEWTRLGSGRPYAAVCP